MVDGTALAQGAYELLADDESLRGNLTDAGFGPLLDWAAATLMAAAEQLTGATDAQAQTRMEETGRAVKAAVAMAVATAEQPTRQQVAALARQPLVAERLGPNAPARLAALRLGRDADANAASLADALQGGRS